MTQEETKEAIKVMQAFADGKKVQFYKKNINKWVICGYPRWDWSLSKYRIAPDQEEPKENPKENPKEKHYRPYTMEEFVKEKHKHDGFIKEIGNYKTYGVIIAGIGNFCIHLERYGAFITYQELFKRFVWSDDETPCGKEVTE